MAVSPSSFHGRFVVLTINIASFGLCFKGKHDIINKNYFKRVKEGQKWAIA